MEDLKKMSDEQLMKYVDIYGSDLNLNFSEEEIAYILSRVGSQLKKTEENEVEILYGID